MAIEVTEAIGATVDKDASKAKSANKAEAAIEAIDVNKANDTDKAKGAHKAEAAIEAIDANKANDALESIRKQLSQLSEYRQGKYLLTQDEQEILLELLNSESLEHNSFTLPSDCDPFTYKDFYIRRNTLGQSDYYSDLIEKIQIRIKLIYDYNMRCARSTFSCLNTKNPKPLEIALIIIKYAHYNLLAHQNAKLARQMRTQECYPKKFNKRFHHTDEDWIDHEYSYTAKKIFTTLIQEISFTQFLFKIGVFAQLFHLLYNRVNSFKEKIRNLPIKNHGKKALKEKIQDGSISIISTPQKFAASYYDNVIINHANLKKHASVLLRDHSNTDYNGYNRNRIAQLINDLGNTDNINSASCEENIIHEIQYRIDKLEFIIAQCRPLSTLYKPPLTNVTVPASSTRTKNRDLPSNNIYDDIIRDATTDINALRASTHYVLAKPALPVNARPSVRPATPPPNHTVDYIVTLSSPTKTLPPARTRFWDDYFSRSTSPEPSPVPTTAPIIPPAKPPAALPVSSLFTPAASNPAATPINDIAPKTSADPKKDENDKRVASRSCCFC